MHKGLSHFRGLFSEDEIERVCQAPFYAGNRHPTWYPLRLDQANLQAIDYCLNRSVVEIQQSGHETWLRKQVQRLLDLDDYSNATAALAEIRAFGALIEAGLSVAPVSLQKGFSTSDFHIDIDELIIEVEVAAKHQDHDQDQLEEAIYSAIGKKEKNFPEGVEHSAYTTGHANVQMVASEHHPGGVPDPNKPNDSVQTNLISRVCGIKGSEEQFSDGGPSILVIDFTAFGGREGARLLFGTSEQAAPIISGHQGLTSGALWYAMYGWKGAPVLEESSARHVQMPHDGRFRLTGSQKSKLSAVLLVLPCTVVLFENPWPIHRLPDKVRLAMCRYPWFDLIHSVGDWRIGDVERKVKLQKGMIHVFEEKFFEMQAFWRMTL